MRLIVRDEETKELIDITNNLYWFEEQGIQTMDEDGRCEDFHGRKYRILFVDRRVNV